MQYGRLDDLGCCMDDAWMMHGYCMDIAWILHERDIDDPFIFHITFVQHSLILRTSFANTHPRRSSAPLNEQGKFRNLLELSNLKLIIQ